MSLSIPQWKAGRDTSESGRVLETSGIIDLANNTVLVSWDGMERFIANSAAPIVGGNGNTIGVVGVPILLRTGHRRNCYAAFL